MFYLLVIFAFFLFSAPFDKTVEASCRPWDSEGDPILMEIISTDGASEDGGTSCGSNAPSGWGTVRSGAKLTNVTSKGTQNYVKNANSTQAAREFNQLAPGARQQKYIQPDGSVTFVKFSTSGEIRMYQASSTKTTSISWYNEKVRYLD